MSRSSASRSLALEPVGQGSRDRAERGLGLPPPMAEQGRRSGVVLAAICPNT